MKQDFLGFALDSGDRSSVARSIIKEVEKNEKRCAWLACLNPHSYAVSRDDTLFDKALRSATWLVPDGIGIVLGARLLGRPVAQRVTGSDVFEEVMNALDDRGGSVFFLGGSEKTLKLISEKLPKDYPHVRLAGTFSPPYKPGYSDDELDYMVAAVNSASPDVLWVGLTAPKQEKFISSLQHRLEVNFAGAVGAVFEFYTGQVRRSPRAFQKLGLEWLPRLIQEPKRLWSRMGVSAPRFVWHVLRAGYVEIVFRGRSR